MLGGSSSTWVRVVSLVCALVLLPACAAQSGGPPAGAEPVSGQTGAGGTASTGSRAPKVLTVGIQREPVILIDRLRADAGRGGGISHVFNIAHNYLAVMDDRGEFIAQLAVELPSVEKGTWRVNADGSMEMTWKLHPNVKWHDGTPFTAADVVFSFNAYKDPETAAGFAAEARDMAAVTAPDPLTVVAQWTKTRIDADQALGLTPLPRHLFEEIYRTDKANFTNSSRLSTEFVGLGPYRLTGWEAGSHLEFAAFDGYFLGRPPLDRVIVRMVPDPNTMAANLLSGALDVLLPSSVSLDAAGEIEERWKGTGNTVLFNPGDRTQILYTQQRPELALPRNGFPNVLVRQAMFHAIDRAALAQASTLGKSPVADSWLNVADPVLPQVQDAIPRYPYDPARAQQLLAQAGWARGADGTLVHQPSGERFEIELHTSAGRDAEQALSIIANDLKAVGAQPRLYVVPPQLAQDQPARARLSGAGTISFSADNIGRDMLYSAGRQAIFQGYSNPRYDALVEKLSTTLVRADRVPIYRDLVQLGMSEAAVMTLHYRIDPYFYVKGVKGVRGHPNTEASWNIFEWDKTAE